MGATNQVDVRVCDPKGVPIGTFTVQLPGEMHSLGNPPPLLDLSNEPLEDPSETPVQLLEDSEYRYTLVLDQPEAAPIALEPRELFSPDTSDWSSGRLRPRLHTGTLPIVVLSGQRELGRVVFEVRSRKLNYRSQYRWMLEEIADSMAELVMERFAPTEQTFALDESADAVTLYARFALLKGLFSGEAFEAAILQILSRPDRTWVEESEWKRPGQTVPMGAAFARQLTRPGPRIPWENHQPATLPEKFQVTRTEETLDTPENRFVKFVLERWSDFLGDVERTLLLEKPTAPVRRGLREVQSVLERLEEVLATGMFQEVGHLTYLPTGSQVLQKRAGYRDLYRAYLQFESAAKLTWDGGDEVYGGGQRNVAALYEYWAFLQLVKITERLCQTEFDHTELLEARKDGMGVALRRGRARSLKGSISRLGRHIQLELWFNQTFGHRTGNRASWSRSMRPDYSILIKPDATYGEPDEVWIHFDAKYRVKSITDLFGQDPTSEEEENRLLSEEKAADAKQAPKRSDLLKMHAYRDAISRSAGAYVIYPGNQEERLQMFHELLPGLGAFALRPTKDGLDTGVDTLFEFIDDVVTHVATQTTQFERARFWIREATRPEEAVTPHPAVPFLTKPPADTLVLLGYVKGPQHLRWIHDQRLYNLRAGGRRGSILPDSRELAAELVVLYEPRSKSVEVWRVEGSPVVFGEAEMVRRRYPHPQGSYFCLRLKEVPRDEWEETMSFEHIIAVKKRLHPTSLDGEPVHVTWLELLR